MSSVGSSPSRHPCQKNALQTFITPRILQMRQYARSIEARDKANIFHISCQQLWRKICRKGTR
jgi:hypothetical protein